MNAASRRADGIAPAPKQGMSTMKWQKSQQYPSIFSVAVGSVGGLSIGDAHLIKLRSPNRPSTAGGESSASCRRIKPVAPGE